MAVRARLWSLSPRTMGGRTLIPPRILHEPLDTSTAPPRKHLRRAVRGSIRTSVVSIIALLVLSAAIVVVLLKSLTPPEAPPVATADSTTSAPAPAVSGSVTIAPELAGRIQDSAVLFIIARKSSGPPFAVKRIAPIRLPAAYRIGPEDVMMAGQSFDGDIRISARVSQTGSAGPPQPGDLEGDHAAPVRSGARNVDVVIARVR